MQDIEQPIILTIAGSDGSGGAGIQADIKTISACGGYAASAIAALTAQNTQGVISTQGVSPDLLQAQIEAIFADMDVCAVKTGMLFGKEQMHVVIDCIRKHKPKLVVVDPVMVSSSGKQLLSNDAIQLMKEELFPLVSVLTPNCDEATLLTGIAIHSRMDMKRAAEALQQMGCRNVIVKGGHLSDTQPKTDILLDENGEIYSVQSETIVTRNTHGTGCTFASALATFLAHGNSMDDAFVLTKQYIIKAMNAAKNQHIGKGKGPLNHFFNDDDFTD